MTGLDKKTGFDKNGYARNSDTAACKQLIQVSVILQCMQLQHHLK